MSKKEILKRLLLCLLVFGIAFLTIGASRASKVYDEAVDLMSSGEYGKAAEAFDSISSFEDAAKLGMYCKAYQILLNGDYEDAYDAFRSFGEYKDCPYLMVYSRACLIEQQAKANPLDLLDAADVFHSIRLFKDSAAREENCYRQLYETAESLLREERFYDSIICFTALGDYSNSSERIPEVYQEWGYHDAEELYASGDYGAAIDAFEDLEGYRDSAERAEQCRRELYALGEQYLNEGAFDDAIDCFELLGEYRDSKDRIKEVEQERRYHQAEEAFVAENYERAIELFENLGDYKDSSDKVENTIAALGGAKALTQIGRNYQNGKDTEPNAQKAMQWYQRAAVRGDADGMCCLAAMYNETGDERAPDKAMEWYLKAAETGSVEAMESIGFMLLGGDAAGQSADDAMSWFRRAAEAGSVHACYQIGSMLETGTGTEMNRTEAIAWYMKASELGDKEAWDEVLRMISEQDESDREKDDVRSVVFQKADQLLAEGRYEESLALFETIDGYSDSQKKQKIIAYLSELVSDSVIELGVFEQNIEDYDGPMPVEWTVTNIENGEALLVCKSELNVPQGSDEWTDEQWHGWLNGEFINSAFTEEERVSLFGGHQIFLNQTACPAFYADLENLAETVIFIRKGWVYKGVEPGDLIRFGHYEQDGDTENGAEEIDWLVLETQDNEALVISLYGMDSQRYHKDYSKITWEECSLRTWLNEEFLNTAFSEEEKGAILTTLVDNSVEQSHNGKAETGNDTVKRQIICSC